MPIGGQGIGGEPLELGNDITSALLISGESGITNFTSNASASPGPNEQPNNGAPVWFKWRANVITRPTDPHGVYTTQKLTQARMRFGTRYGPGFIHQTNFPTVITVFKALKYPITGYGDLKAIASATRYAYWEDQSEVQFDTEPPLLYGTDVNGVAWEVIPTSLDLVDGQGYYYIRVDSAIVHGGGIKRGSFTLWWNLADQGYKPVSCTGCAPSTTAADGQCLLVFKPNIHANPTTDSASYGPSAGKAPAGTYLVKYCGGAWNYYSGWVVGRIPPVADQSWTAYASGRGNAPWENGYFFSWQYSLSGVQYGHFTEDFLATSTGTTTAIYPAGYRSAAWAEWVVSNNASPGYGGCPQAVFQHDGATAISMQWTDQFDGNYAGPSGSPVYSLTKIVPVFVANYACGEPVGGGTTIYDVTFVFTQSANTNYSNVTCTCLLQGGVVSSNSLGGQTVYADSTFNRQVGLSPNRFTLRIEVDPALNKQVLATLRFTDTGGILGTVGLAFDLTPYVYIINKQAAGATCGLPESENFGFQVRGLKADSLSLSIDPAHTVTSAILDAEHGCSASQPFNFGAVGCAAHGKTFAFQRLATPADIPLFWSDGPNALPPSILTV